MFNLEGLNLRELKDLRVKIDRAIASTEEQQRKAAIAAVEEIVRNHGFNSYADLLAPPKASPKTPAAPKYRNPEDPEQTWTGRGRQPHWIARALAEGRSLSELEIEPSNDTSPSEAQAPSRRSKKSEQPDAA